MDSQTNKKIESYLKDIQKFLDLKLAYLFGSYVTSGYTEEKSDIDLALITDHLDESNRHDIIKKCIRNVYKYKLDIQPLVYSFEEFQNKENPFLEDEIIAKGKRIL